MEPSNPYADSQELPKWKKVLLSQDWSLVPLFVFGIAVTLVAQVKEPSQRVIFRNDVTIANQNAADSVNYIVAFLAPFACLFASVVVCEYVVHRKSESTTAAVAATLHFLGTSVTMFFTVIAITEVRCCSRCFGACTGKVPDCHLAAHLQRQLARPQPRRQPAPCPHPRPRRHPADARLPPRQPAHRRSPRCTLAAPAQTSSAAAMVAACACASPPAAAPLCALPCPAPRLAGLRGQAPAPRPPCLV
jgi:hypothetical protein